jgi:hypothetical protein
MARFMLMEQRLPAKNVKHLATKPMGMPFKP